MSLSEYAAVPATNRPALARLSRTSPMVMAPSLGVLVGTGSSASGSLAWGANTSCRRAVEW